MVLSTRVTKRGFTLIELLVVVSIIVLLISLMMPAINMARRSARVMSCNTNMKQHAQAATAYAAANKDRMPHGPEGPAREWSNPRGVIGRPALIMGSDVLPTNGWRFPSTGIPLVLDVFSHVNPGRGNTGFSADIRNASMFDFYLVTLGPYVVEGEGPAMLQDVFICPSHTGRFWSWDRWRKLIREEKGRLLRPEDPRMKRIGVGSYRYCVSNLVDSAVLFRALNGRLKDQYASVVYDAVRNRWPYKHIVFNSFANVNHPDKKVLFWLWRAPHDRRIAFWLQSGATTTVAVADGSARVLTPYSEAAQPDPLDNAGPTYRFRSSSTPRGWPGFFYLNWGGIKGRDL